VGYISIARSKISWEIVRPAFHNYWFLPLTEKKKHRNFTTQKCKKEVDKDLKKGKAPTKSKWVSAITVTTSKFLSQLSSKAHDRILPRPAPFVMPTRASEKINALRKAQNGFPLIWWGGGFAPQGHEHPEGRFLPSTKCRKIV